MATGLLDLDDQATISYNGISFGSHSSIKVNTEFIHDEADRTVIAHKHLLTVQATVTPDDADGLDPTMEEMRASLSKSCGNLLIQSAGFGNVDVNGSTGTDDLNFGPKPRVLSWEPIGNNLAAEVIWQVEFMLSPCPDTADSGLMSFSYEVAYSINTKGYTTRTVSGSLSIAMKRSGGNLDPSDNREIPETADQYRDEIVVKAPVNFKRDTQNYSLSADKRTLTFTIVDREIESKNAWPAGVTEISASHRVLWRKRGRARKLLPNVITANITLAPDQPRARAWEIFRGIFFSRISAASQNTSYPVILESLEVNEDIYGTNISFSLEYTITAELSTFFTLTKVLSPVSVDWQSWKQTMLLTEDDRGIAQLESFGSDDKIVDLCDKNINKYPDYRQPGVTPVIGFSTYCNQQPPPQYSYIRFDASLTDETETNTYFAKTLGSATVTPNAYTPYDPSSTIEDIQTDAINSEVQGVPYQRFRWRGVAERVGYQIPKPHLTHIGSGANRIPVKLIGKPLFLQKFEGLVFCQPRYTAAWNFLYEIEERPVSQGSRYASDPLESTDG